MPLLSRKVTNIVAETKRRMTQNIKHKLHGLNARCTVRPRELWKTEDYTPPVPDQLPHGKTQRDLDRRARVKKPSRTRRNTRYTKKFDSTLGYPGEGPGHTECKDCVNGVCCPIAGHYHKKTKPLSQAARRKREAAKTKPKKRKEVEYELCQLLTNEECQAQEHAHDATQTLYTKETIGYLDRTFKVPGPKNSPASGVASPGMSPPILVFDGLDALRDGKFTTTLNSSEYPPSGEEANASITGNLPDLGGIVAIDDKGSADDALLDMNDVFADLLLPPAESALDVQDELDTELMALDKIAAILKGDKDAVAIDDSPSVPQSVNQQTPPSSDPLDDLISLTGSDTSSDDSDDSSSDDSDDSSPDTQGGDPPLLPTPSAPPAPSGSAVSPPRQPDPRPVIQANLDVKRVKIFCSNPGGERPNVLGQWCNTLKWGFHIVNPFSVSVETMEINADLDIGMTELRNYTTANRQTYHLGALGCASDKKWSSLSYKHVAEFFTTLYPLMYEEEVYTELVRYLLTEKLLGQRRWVAQDGTISDIMTPLKYHAGKHPHCSQYMTNRQTYTNTLIHVTNQLLLSGLMEWTAHPGSKAQIHFRRADRLLVSPCTDPSSA